MKSKTLMYNSIYNSLIKYAVRFPPISERVKGPRSRIVPLSCSETYRVNYHTINSKIKYKRSAIRLGRRRKIFVVPKIKFTGTYGIYHLDGKYNYLNDKRSYR